jgi:hypothetical protein
MGAFDKNNVYTASPYNGEQRMESVTWIVITVVIGCVFIAKRLYFKRERNRLGKGNPRTDFVDVMSTVVLGLLWFRIIFGPPNPFISTVLMTIFITVLAIGVGFLLNSLWQLAYGKKSANVILPDDKKSFYSYTVK